MAERRDLIELVGAQLSALVEGVELTDGFGLFIVAARTWLAAAVARVLLRDRLPRAVHASLEIDTAARELTQLLAPGVARTTVVHCGGTRGASVDAWRPLFRRLNENRNAVVREHDGALVVIVSEAQIEALAGEAPDLWSIAIVRVVGWLSLLELHRAMTRDYAVLESLMLAEPQALPDAVRRLGYPALLEVMNFDDRKQAVRDLYELLCGQWPAAPPNEPTLAHFGLLKFESSDFPTLRVEADWGTFLWHIFTEPDGSPTYAVGKLGLLYIDEGARSGLEIPEVTLVPAEDELTAWRRLLDARLASTDVATRLCVAAPSMLDGAIGEFLRRWFDLVLAAACDDPTWRVLAGTAELAPVIRCPPNVGVRIDGSNAEFHLIRAPVELGGPTQLWLPTLNPDSLGATPLYRAG